MDDSKITMLRAEVTMLRSILDMAHVRCRACGRQVKRPVEQVKCMHCGNDWRFEAEPGQPIPGGFLEGAHLCERHQGDQSKYDESECVLCSSLKESLRLKEELYAWIYKRRWHNADGTIGADHYIPGLHPVEAKPAEQ